jgi:hypothetical protein
MDFWRILAAAENVRQRTATVAQAWLNLVHGVPECRQGSRAPTVAAATFATPTLFKISPFSAGISAVF